MARTVLADLSGRPADAARFVLDLSNQQVALIERTARGPRERAAARSGDPDFEESVRRMRDMVARGRSDALVDLFLPDELTLARVESFPAEARRQLRDEAWWRLDSLTPYRPEELCYDVSLIGTEPTTGFLSVAIAVAPREIVDEAVDYARAWGFAPQRVTGAPIEGFPHGPLYLEVENASAEVRPLRRAAGLLIAATVALAMLGVARAVWTQEALATDLEARRAAADARLADALQVRAAALELADAAVRPLSRRRVEELAAEWVDALVAALPPGAEIDRIRMVDRSVRIEGRAPSAAAAFTAVSSTGRFVDVRLASSVAADVDAEGRVWFAIEAELQPREAEA